MISQNLEIIIYLLFLDQLNQCQKRIYDFSVEHVIAKKQALILVHAWTWGQRKLFYGIQLLIVLDQKGYLCLLLRHLALLLFYFLVDVQLIQGLKFSPDPSCHPKGNRRKYYKCCFKQLTSTLAKFYNSPA